MVAYITFSQRQLDIYNVSKTTLYRPELPRQQGAGILISNALLDNVSNYITAITAINCCMYE